MSLNLLSKIKAAGSVAKPLSADSEKVLAEIREENKVKSAHEAANILAKVVAGETPLADVQMSTDTIFRAIVGAVGDNLAKVMDFIRTFPNRLYIGKIPEFVKATNLGQEIGEIYLGRLLSEDFSHATWQKPAWLKEEEPDDGDFFFAVQGLFASLLALGAGESEFSTIASFLQSAYAERLKTADRRVWNLLEGVAQTGRYYLPGTQQNGNGHHNGHRPGSSIPASKYADPREATRAEVEAFNAGKANAAPPNNVLAEKLADPPAEKPRRKTREAVSV